MFYLTNSLMQRFISFNAELIASVQEEYKFNELEIKDAKIVTTDQSRVFLFVSDRLWFLATRSSQLFKLNVKRFVQEKSKLQLLCTADGASCH